MSKRNSIIIILVVLALIIGGLLFFYFRSGNTPTQISDTVIPTTKNVFTNNNTGNTTTGSTATTTGENQTNVPAKVTAQLMQVYKNPTSGSVFFTSKDNKDVLRFVDRSNGNVYEYVPESQTGELVRITNTTIPKIQEALWSALGSNVVFRYLDNDIEAITSFASKITSTSSNGQIGEISGSFLSSNIKQLVSNPKGDKLFSFFEKNDGSGSYGVTSAFDGTGKKQIFSSPASSWNISWPKDDTLTFTTRPSYKDSGFLFFFNINSGILQRIFGDILGLSTLTNNDASLVAYSGNDNNRFHLDIYDVRKKTNDNLTMSTLADKCAWGTKINTVLYCGVPQNVTPDLYPDAWYQGLESFSDNIWLVNTATGEMQQVYEIGQNENASIDVTDMKVSLSGDYISFINKTDLSLWLLKIQ